MILSCDMIRYMDLFVASSIKSFPVRMLPNPLLVVLYNVVRHYTTPTEGSAYVGATNNAAN
jgi:hypothetical protein